MSKELSTTDFILADWKQVDEELIREAVMKEGKPIIAQTLDITLQSLYDWFKVRKIKAPIVRNFNYFNSRKPEAEREPYEDTLSKQILAEMTRIRDKRLKDIEDSYIEVVCPTCGKTFKTKRKVQAKYCSQECVTHRVRSEEELKRLSESCMGRESWNKGMKMPEEAVQKMRENLKKSWTEEKKELQRQKQKEVWYNPELLKRHSEMAKAGMTDERKEYISLKTREAMARPEVKQRMTETLMKNYGVPYACLTPNCIASNNVISKVNRKWQDILGISDEDLEFPLDGFSFDMKIGNTLVEIDPTYTHSCVVNKKGYGGKDKRYHILKTIVANKSGFNCVHIWDWDKIDKIKNLLKIDKKVLDASTIVVKRMNNSEALLFLEKYSLGTVTSCYLAFGAYDKDRLCAIIALDKLLCGWEIIDCCAIDGISLDGIEKLLFDSFIEEVDPECVIAYSDKSKDIDDIYLSMGLDFLEYTQPQKHWFNESTKEHIIAEECNFDGYLPIYDCGNAAFIWKKEN